MRRRRHHFTVDYPDSESDSSYRLGYLGRPRCESTRDGERRRVDVAGVFLRPDRPSDLFVL